MAACFDKRLFRQNLLDRIPCFLRNFLQMSVRIYANQETEPNTGADQRHKAAAIDAVLQFYVVGGSRHQRFASADNGAGFIGDFAAADRRLKKRIGKTQRPMIRNHVKRVVQHKQRTVQQRSGVCGQAFQIILREELGQQRVRAVVFLFDGFHGFASFICAESTSSFFFIILSNHFHFKHKKLYYPQK